MRYTLLSDKLLPTVEELPFLAEFVIPESVLLHDITLDVPGSASIPTP